MASSPPTILCLASYEKGHDFFCECKRQGARVLLLTSQSLEHTANWPRGCIDEIFHVPDNDHVWNRTHALHGVAYLARTRQIDRIVPLDDFDLELAALLREHLRLPGLGETTTRFFRDKLAMRLRAQEAGIPVPEFVPVIHHPHIAEFLARVPGPWLLKPRSSAGAIGIKKLHHADQVWALLEQLGDQQSFYLLERFVPSDIFHVDTTMEGGQVRFAVTSQYGHPPLEVSHGGGIFTTQLLRRGSLDEQLLLALNQRVLTHFGLTRGVSHTEFLRRHEDGEFYFLETSARVGGAHIADLVAAATGVNLWKEWAKLEVATSEHPYHLPPLRTEYAGLLVSLARQEYPDTSAYHDPEIVWRMSKKHHVGLIVQSPDPVRVEELLASYRERVRQDFHAVAAPQSRATG